MTLETFFTEEDVEEIYDNTIMYSILKYQTFQADWQQIFESRYQHALDCFQKRNQISDLLENTSIDRIKNNLLNYQAIYQQIQAQNRPVIDLYAPKIEAIILKSLQTKTTALERVNFLFDFVTNYVQYSTETFQYCLQVPPIDDFYFDFQNQVPVDATINGMLVMGQGLCDDISNLMVYLAKRLDLNMKKITCNYNNALHSLNLITLPDGFNYLIDATRLIRQDKTKEECFLVSKEELNKHHNYQFKEDLPITMTYQGTLPQNTKDLAILLTEIESCKPQITDLNSHTLKR